MSTGRLERYLRGFRRRFEPALARYLHAARRRLRRSSSKGAELGTAIHSFTTRSGKRIRAALVHLGYELAGGKPTSRILQPAIAVELLHSFFLIHDDIIDQSALRRGRPTVHRYFAGRYRRLLGLPMTTATNLGSSLGIIAGDLGFSLAIEALLASRFPHDRIRRATTLFLQATDDTIVGQMLDMILPLKRGASIAEAEAVLRLKTATYSVLAPLRLGMILAGAQPTLLRQIERYAVPVGMAFQIQDDILGVFGSERELGKPVTSDLEEGKQTLLVVYARERAAPAQRKRLDALVGNRQLTRRELSEARAIFIATGARVACENVAKQMIARGQQALRRLRIPGGSRLVLHQLAEYVLQRST